MLNRLEDNPSMNIEFKMLLDAATDAEMQAPHVLRGRAVKIKRGKARHTLAQLF